MFFQRALTTVLLGVLPFGCVAAPIDGDESESIDEAEQAIEVVPMRKIVSINGMHAGLLAAPENVAGMAELATAALTEPAVLADTEGGQQLLGYIVRCALTQEQTITVENSVGDKFEMEGLVGLAPHWAVQGIGASDQRWVSACLLAHANAYGMDVTIALQGLHPALDELPPEHFVAQEAAFYGNVFGEVAMFACEGSTPSDNPRIPSRVCGRTTACRFTIAGTCWTPQESQVCGEGPNAYGDCIGELEPAPPVEYAEVITVYTKPGTFGNPPGCTHDPDERGWPLQKTCSSLVERVCEEDLYCCETDWDDICVRLAETMQIFLP